jgi:hypothetical protein
VHVYGVDMGWAVGQERRDADEGGSS